MRIRSLQLARRTRRTRSRGGRSGFSLIELLVATTVLVLGMLGAIGTLTTVNKLGQSNRESIFAYQAARSMVESLQAEAFEDVYERFNADPADDPDGAATAPGMDFDVPGLTPQAGDVDGLAGRVLFPVSPGSVLREDLADASFGMPRDLNGDGVVDADDHTFDRIVLPVRVRVEWTGRSGDRFVEFTSILGRRR